MKRLLFTLIGIFTAIIGNNIHGSFSWTIVDFFFWPLCWIKWIIFHEVNISLIKNSFSFFLQ